jgi:hypothetical protein
MSFAEQVPRGEAMWLATLNNYSRFLSIEFPDSTGSAGRACAYAHGAVCCSSSSTGPTRAAVTERQTGCVAEATRRRLPSTGVGLLAFRLRSLRRRRRRRTGPTRATVPMVPTALVAPATRRRLPTAGVGVFAMSLLRRRPVAPGCKVRAEVMIPVPTLRIDSVAVHPPYFSHGFARLAGAVHLDRGVIIPQARHLGNATRFRLAHGEVETILDDGTRVRGVEAILGGDAADEKCTGQHDAHEGTDAVTTRLLVLVSLRMTRARDRERDQCAEWWPDGACAVVREALSRPGAVARAGKRITANTRKRHCVARAWSRPCCARPRRASSAPTSTAAAPAPRSS